MEKAWLPLGVAKTSTLNGCPSRNDLSVNLRRPHCNTKNMSDALKHLDWSEVPPRQSTHTVACGNNFHGWTPVWNFEEGAEAPVDLVAFQSVKHCHDLLTLPFFALKASFQEKGAGLVFGANCVVCDCEHNTYLCVVNGSIVMPWPCLKLTNNFFFGLFSRYFP